MKNYLLTTALLSILFLRGFTQSDFRFADSTAQWNILEHQFGWFPIYPDLYTTYIYQAKKDTVVNSISYQAISGDGILYLLRKDSFSRIYQYYTDTSEYFLYDFGKTTGDTIHQLNHTWIQAYAAIVDSVDSVYIGHWRKRMYVTVGWEGGFVIGNDVWIDGIGSVSSHLLHPSSEQLVVDGPEWSLLCYFENASLLYHDDFYDTCTYNSPLSVNEVENNFRLNLSPNPATTQITLQSENNFPSSATFQLFDVGGQLVLQQALIDKTNLISLAVLSKGMYLYRMISPGHPSASGKLAIE